MLDNALSISLPIITKCNVQYAMQIVINANKICSIDVHLIPHNMQYVKTKNLQQFLVYKLISYMELLLVRKDARMDTMDLTVGVVNAHFHAKLACHSINA